MWLQKEEGDPFQNPRSIPVKTVYSQTGTHSKPFNLVYIGCLFVDFPMADTADVILIEQMLGEPLMIMAKIAVG